MKEFPRTLLLLILAVVVSSNEEVSPNGERAAKLPETGRRNRGVEDVQCATWCPLYLCFALVTPTVPSQGCSGASTCTTKPWDLDGSDRSSTGGFCSFLSPIFPELRKYICGELPFLGTFSVASSQYGATGGRIRYSGRFQSKGVFGSPISFDFALSVTKSYYPSGLVGSMKLTPVADTVISFTKIASSLIGSSAIFGSGTSYIDTIFKKFVGSPSLKISELVFGVNGYGLRITGTWGVFSFNLVTLSNTDKVGQTLIFQVSFPIPGNQQLKDNLGELYNMLSVFTSDSMSFLVSNNDADLSGTVFATNVLGKVDKGVEFQLVVRFDASSGNPLQAWLGNFFKQSFTAILFYQDQLNVGMSLKFPDIPITSSIKLTNGELGMKLKDAFLVATFQCGVIFPINGQIITLLGKMEVGFQPPISLTLRLELQGVINNAFNIKSLTISDVAGEIGLTPVFPWITNFEVIGTVTWGPADPTPGPVGGTLGFKVDIKEPTNNYFLLNMNPLTLGHVVYYLGGRSRYNALPGCVRDSGFPNGVLYSWAVKDQEVGPAKIPIFAGYYLTGKFNLFGFTADVTIIANPDGYMKADIVFSPWSLFNGLVTFQRSQDDSSRGPRFFFEILNQAYLEGYFSSWLFSAYLRFQMDLTTMTSVVTVNIFNLYNSEITLSASYAPLDISYTIKVSVVDVKSFVTTKLQETKTKAFNSLDYARQKVAEAQAALKREAGRVCNSGTDCQYSCNVNLLETEETRIFSNEEERLAFLEVEVERHIEAGSVVASEKLDFAAMNNGLQELADSLSQANDEELRLFLGMREREAVHATEDLYERALLETTGQSRSGDPWSDLSKFIDDLSRGPSAWAKQTLSTVRQSIRELGTRIADAGCGVGEGVCGIGCVAVSSTVEAAAQALDAAIITLKAVNTATSSIVSVLDFLSNGLSLQITFGGQISTNKIRNTFVFDMRVGGDNLSFSVDVDIDTVRFADLGALAWDKVKAYLINKAPDATKLFQ